MSHISTISTEGVEFERPVIEAMCQRHKSEVMQQEHFNAYGGAKPCDFAIGIPGCRYEVGVVESKTDPGKYQVLADFWNAGGLDKVLGEQGEVFRELYVEQSDIMWAEGKGYEWEESFTEENNRKLTINVNDDDFEGGDW